MTSGRELGSKIESWLGASAETVHRLCVVIRAEQGDLAGWWLGELITTERAFPLRRQPPPLGEAVKGRCCRETVRGAGLS